MMKKFLLVLIFLTLQAHANLADNFANLLFQSKVDELHKKALTCSPLELDKKSNLDVTDWIKIQPPLPSWQLLTDIESTANESRKYARSIGGKDKLLHCLAGCYIAKKLDYRSAVLVGWYKELQDASDCSKKTSFEKKDYEATIQGAHGGKSDLSCEKFCKK